MLPETQARVLVSVGRKYDVMFIGLANNAASQCLFFISE